MKQSSIVAAIVCLLLASCKPQVKDVPPKANLASFLAKYNSYEILLGCIEYAEEVSGRLSKDSIYNSSEFYRIAGILQGYSRASDNYDSLVDDFLTKNPTIDFKSDKAIRSIRSYVECDMLVDDVIFGKIDSDDKSDEMKALEEKILKVPEVLTIYRSYIPPGNDLSSLPSSGIALNIQIGYYLRTLDIDKRNGVLKALL